MRIKILFDKEGMGEKFQVGWGISYLIGNDILFDTGEKFEYICKNAKAMGLRLEEFKKIVISHDHWDHTGGLWELLRLNKDVTVYGCVNFSKEFKERVMGLGAELIEVKDTAQIDESIYSTGQSMGTYEGSLWVEQGLVIDRGDKLILICGCAHPGLLNMIEKSRVIFGKDVYCALGGFHLMDKEKRFIDYVVREVRKLLEKIGPGHCTGFEAVSQFRQEFGENFIEVKVGREFQF
jgi:7,8-dihydropterin-6-yl-methyl-4-(beta-D-ribofuranosyl)aminobenzene 5'-phosphate synthase